MNLTYREGTKNDLEGLKALGILSYGQFKDDLSEKNWNKMDSILRLDENYLKLLDISTCFICLDGEQLVGMAYLVHNGNPTDIFQADWSYIRMVGVNPNYAGQGIGKKLTQMCIDLAKKTDEKIIALHTSEFMHAARHIYESLGFEIVKEIEPLFEKKYWLYHLNIN
ncbi:GNAT family N-acetyltransferase [Flavobacterium oreochromis]|uniref:N-acetyltransferase domain-containing protein n=2 Tax=Flavobacterium TaxID=237 RepID=A0A246G8A8_9FLAO|nr:GNAT family N-acetyltransferase [Flavobacterium oreochromis]OWP75079.1 hypothetical protein BWK62_12740 [Flavobacterium oreochromis]OWP76213.1 hypothetical protein BWG23_08785 [Flavobacterium oreochromis]POR24060.1 hypothetical protein BWK58_08780 [Flavobacterium columnare]QYS86482.1 GNAT family N-acetyltransferase [Flavobacterium oreochromis]